MSLLVLFNLLYVAVWEIIIGTFEPTIILKRLGLALIGFNAYLPYGTALGVMWFVYTLILCKLMIQFASKTINFLFCLIAIFGATLMYHYGISYSNAYTCWFVSFPFFYLGFGLKRFKLELNLYDVHTINGLLLLIISIFVIVFVGYFNGAPWMFENKYGNDYMLFLLGGIAGTVSIYLIAKLLPGGGGCKCVGNWKYIDSRISSYIYCCISSIVKKGTNLT